MKRGFPELERLRIAVSGDAKQRHLDSIAHELATPPRRRRRPRRALAIAIAAALLIPTAAIASEDSVPGDALYPIKLVLEPIRAIVDRDVIARHRVTELEVLVDSRAVDSVSDDPVDNARDALRDVDTPELRQRFDRVIDRLTDRTEDSSPSDAPVEERPPATDRPASGSVATTTTTVATGDQPRDRDRPPSTTTTSQPTDRPPPDG